MNFRFEHNFEPISAIHGPAPVRCIVETDAVNWREVLDTFFDFLRGSGYQITTSEVAEYLNDLNGGDR